MSEKCDVKRSDAKSFLASQPDDSIDLLFTSPPYENARTYGIDFDLTGQAWVDWMHEIVSIASKKVKGLIAINCEGKTTDFRYSCTPFLLAADLHRSGFNLRKPIVFHRVGIAGSGGPEWLRNDWEPIICITRPGSLPWSDNTACGKPPVYSPGGPMSNRLTNGKRTTTQTRRKKDGKRLKDGNYVEPEIANPGNVIKCKVGGGQMGHAIAHHNEAPFPLDLPAFFVKSFCPPNGVVCDPFVGSGTTAHAAIENGRRFVGCDIRKSQVELTMRRIKTVTPNMFNEIDSLLDSEKEKV